MRQKTNPTAKVLKGAIEDLSGQATFLRVDKTGRIYWKDPYPKKKK